MSMNDDVDGEDGASRRSEYDDEEELGAAEGEGYRVPITSDGVGCQVVG